jgi:hypothetical protein
MNSPRFADIRSRMAAGKDTPTKPECETEPDDQDDAPLDPENDEEEEMTDTTNTTDTEQPESGQNASDATARIKAVAASENVKGREALALSMLADDDFADMSAAAMIKVLGNTNKADAAGGDGAQDVIDAIRGQNANTGVDGEQKPMAEDHSKGWKKATDAVNARNGFKK